MKWDYRVDDKAAEFEYIIWRVQNRTNPSVSYNMIYEDSQGNVNISSQMPLMYVGRVEKIGRATLVIKKLIFEDMATYFCKLDRKFGVDTENDVQLVVTGTIFLELSFRAACMCIELNCHITRMTGSGCSGKHSNINKCHK